MLVAVIAKPTLEAVRKEIERARPYADLFEIRLDALEELEWPERFEVPVLFTFRRGRVGEEERLRWLERLLALEPEYCDLEVDTDPGWIERLARQYPKTRFIGSYHNFEKMPEDLEGLLASMQHRCFFHYKIAVRVCSSAQGLRLMAFARGQTGVSAIAMGSFGLPFRVLGPVMGNLFDYAGTEEEEERYSLRTLCEVYRYRKLNCATSVYALLGDPVAQSPGPLFHNRTFGERNAVYVAMQVGVGELEEVVGWMRRLPFFGCSVTMPLKEAIVPLLDVVEMDAAQIGAVNTVAAWDGRWVGSNTDGIGAMRALGEEMQGKRVAILGAGGTARAIAFEAKRRGAEIALFNRSQDRVQRAAMALGCAWFPLEEVESHECDLVLNALPVAREGVELDVSYVRSAFGSAMWREQAALQQKAWAKTKGCDKREEKGQCPSNGRILQ